MLILWTIHLPNDLCPTYLSARLPLSAVGERDTYRIHMEYAVCVVLSCMGYELYIFWFSHILGGLWYIFPFFGSRASLFIRFHSIELFDHVIKRQWQKYNNEIDKRIVRFVHRKNARAHARALAWVYRSPKWKIHVMTQQRFMLVTHEFFFLDYSWKSSTIRFGVNSANLIFPSSKINVEMVFLFNLVLMSWRQCASSKPIHIW